MENKQIFDLIRSWANHKKKLMNEGAEAQKKRIDDLIQFFTKNPSTDPVELRTRRKTVQYNRSRLGKYAGSRETADKLIRFINVLEREGDNFEVRFDKDDYAQ